MSNGKGLAIAGLILGLIGAGLGGYAFFDGVVIPMLNPETPTSNTTTYYVEDNYITLPTDSGYVPLGNIWITFTTTQTSTLYVMFSCYARIQTATGDTVFVNMYINGSEFTSTHYYINAIGTAIEERYPVTMQAYNNSLLPGTYNISIQADVDDVNTAFFLNSLYVQLTT